jgi:hypothetical protein
LQYTRQRKEKSTLALEAVTVDGQVSQVSAEAALLAEGVLQCSEDTLRDVDDLTALLTK